MAGIERLSRIERIERIERKCQRGYYTPISNVTTRFRFVHPSGWPLVGLESEGSPFGAQVVRQQREAGPHSIRHPHVCQIYEYDHLLTNHGEDIKSIFSLAVVKI